MSRYRKILILSTYPHVNPQHGGQKRADAIVRRYKELGLQVAYVGIYVKEAYGRRGSDDVYIEDSKSLSHINNANRELTGDLATGWIARDDEAVYSAIRNKISSFSPDIIQVEQPYLTPLINRLREDGYISWQKIVYSSHNVEWRMKADMLKNESHVSAGRKKDIVEQIKGLEHDIIKNSDYVISVTAEDCEYNKEHGAKRVVLAPNGIDAPIYDRRAIEKLQSEYERLGVRKTIVFVGSWHQPNWQGFLELVSTGLGYIPHDTRIVIVGSIAGLIEEYFRGRSVVEITCFAQRAILMGRVSERRLGAVLNLANLIILPVTSGGGSNLKTAEAIQSKKATLASEHAMRGYGREFMDLPYVHVAKGPAEFRKRMVQLVQEEGESRSLSGKQVALSDAVLWDKVLVNLKEVIAE